MNASAKSENHQLIRRSLVEPLAVAAVIFALVVSGFIATRNIRELQENRLRVRSSNEMLTALLMIEASLMDAESGQRGYLITGNESYLKTFDDATHRSIQSLDLIESLAQNKMLQHEALRPLRDLVEERIAELQHVLDVQASQGREAARSAVATDAGKRTMDRIREKTAAMRQVENDLLSERELAAARSYHSGRTTSILSTVIGLVLVMGVLYLLERNRRKAEQAAMVLRTTRESLQLALDSAELGSWNINPATRELTGDRQFRKILGFEEGEITYQRAIDALHPADRGAVEAAIAASTRPESPAPYAIEYRVIHPDGSVHWVLAQGAANFTGKGSQRTISSFDGTLVDITERKCQEQRLLESEQAALAANRSKSEFLANMSHEIRTPMAAILGYADVLLGHLKDPDNRNCVQVMKRNGEHLLELINDILDLSRIEAGKLDVSLETVSLPQLVADVQSLMHVRADEKNLQFEAEFVGLVPATFRTDPTRLRQVLINLIGNAIKFTKQGSVVLSVSFLSRNLPQGTRPKAALDPKTILELSSALDLLANLDTQGILSFSVRDTGIGMSDEQQQRLFKPFSQGDSSVTRAYGGSGLGLAISKRLVSMLSGHITIHSKLGEGATFTVMLPIANGDPVELIQPDLIATHRETKTTESSSRSLHCRILVVDDRRDVRHISQHFLEKAGAHVSTAEDGRQGIAAALAARDAHKPFDLIVMDMQMPNLDGLQATAELRSAGIQCPIIALTADAMKGDRERCLAGGCDDYLSKPIDQLQLVNLVAHYTQDISQAELRERRDKRMVNLQGRSR